jgi:hypothetical protein
LNRFIAKLVERSLLFFTMLRGSTKNRVGHRTTKSLRRFEALSRAPANTLNSRAIIYTQFIRLRHALSCQQSPSQKEITRDGKIEKQQFPVYFVSEVLTGNRSVNFLFWNQAALHSKVAIHQHGKQRHQQHS